jgi:hypothetical protein
MRTGNFETKLNNIPFGILVGMLVAILASLTIFSFKNTVSLSMFENTDRLILYVPYLKLGAILNLAPFFIFNQFNMLNAQKGVIISTIIMFFFVVVVNYLL